MKDIYERFMAKVDKKSQAPCWIWTGAMRGEYGIFTVNGNVVPAHRFSLAWHKGGLRPRDVVGHKCDNPPCVNPKHLFACSQSENMKDAGRKGRHPSQVHRRKYMGERNANSVLTVQKVRDIRRLYRAGHSQRKIAAYFGIGKSTVGRIVRGETWSQEGV